MGCRYHRVGAWLQEGEGMGGCGEGALRSEARGIKEQEMSRRKRMRDNSAALPTDAQMEWNRTNEGETYDE